MERTEYDFRRAVVPRGDDLGVVLPVEGRRAEVDQPHLRVLHPTHVPPLKKKTHRSDDHAT